MKYIATPLRVFTNDHIRANEIKIPCRQTSHSSDWNKGLKHFIAPMLKRFFAWGFAVILLQGALNAGDQVAWQPAAKSDAPLLSSPLQKPAWLSDFSLTIKEGYDSNVFLSGVDQNYMPKGKQSLKNIDSWVTTISPRVGVNLAPALPDQKALKELSFIYAPDIAIYHDATSESNTAHRFITAAKGKIDAVTFSLENTFTYIHGDKDGPVYPGGFLSAYGVAAPRERREQFQDRSKISFQYDQEKFFLRPVASFLYYDLRTNLKNPALKSTPSGYQNFPDRYDVNGGLDFGYKVTPDVALTLGYRYGHQYQQQLAWSLYSSSNDYQRVLFGMEGKPLKWLKVQFQPGPDFRSYAPDTKRHTTPLRDKAPVVFYGEANVCAEITSKDTVTFQFKQFEWLSSCGNVPYTDTAYELNYSRKLTDKLTANLGVRAGEADYTMAYTTGGLRDDWMVTLSTSLRYAFNAHLMADLCYSFDRGLNGFDDLPVTQQPDSKRQFARHLVSLGLQWKF